MICAIFIEPSTFMKIFYTITLGIIFSFLSIYFCANFHEGGPGNSIGMYFIVFAIPALLVIILNASFLEILRRFQLKYSRALSSLPPIALLLLILTPYQIPYFDGKLCFIGIVGSISVSLTNLLWNLKLKINNN